MTNQRCKGARDLLPQDTERFRYIEDAFRSSCVSWGYKEVKTPTLEYLHLFTAAGTLTPSMLNKVYSFLDWDGWSGERVVLRPDGTIPVARLYIENLSRQEISRLFYITNVFAFEETGTENRERWQCGVELLGDSRPTSDVEIIMLAVEILRNLYIQDIKLRLSHAGLLKALLKEMKLATDDETTLLNEIRNGKWEILEKTQSRNPHVKRFLSLLLELRGKSSVFMENLKVLPDISPKLKKEIDNFIQITNLLDTLKCDYQIDITSTRGFEYYTGLCFQIQVNGRRIGGGGRYNDLVPLIGGSNTPSCGFALYIDPLMDSVKSKAGQDTGHGVLVKSEAKTAGVVELCFNLAQSLRSIGYIAEFEFGKRQTKWRWVVTVQQKSPGFTVTDQVHNKTRKAASISRVVDIIGGST